MFDAIYTFIAVAGFIAWVWGWAHVASELDNSFAAMLCYIVLFGGPVALLAYAAAP